ncbi:MAG TPA: T9SS type A sorting domain-containing protein [bacterium]|jgi:hypothetical protein
MSRIHRTYLMAGLILLCAAALAAAPTYRSFIEWNGPYYHVRHSTGADSSDDISYAVNNPLPLYSLPFSSPAAVALYGTLLSQTAFIVDHDHSRVQVFSTGADWRVESLTYNASAAAGYFGGRTLSFGRGELLAASERILINNGLFTRVNSLAGYAATDSVYTMVYTGLPGDGGVATLPSGWNLGASDSVRVEYAFANPPGNSGNGDIDYVLSQTSPTAIPLQLNETTSNSDPALNDVTSLVVNPSVRTGKVLDLYAVNALPGGAGTLASYDLSIIGPGGAFHHVDTYPGALGRPYAVKMVDTGVNIPGTMLAGTPSGVQSARLSLSIRNASTFLGHNYRVAFSFDTTSSMNQSAAPDNLESDIAFDPVRGRLHMVFCRDNAVQGTAYSYSDDYGQTWSAAVRISPTTLGAIHDRPRIAVRSTGEVHVVYEAINLSGQRHLYHIVYIDGAGWSITTELTDGLTPGIVTENRYANLLVDPLTDDVHLIWAGDDDVYHQVYTTSWSGPTLVASGAGSGFSAPHAVMDGSGDIHLAFVSDAVPPCHIGYMTYNGAEWGSNEGGSFTPGSVDEVTSASGVADDGGGRGELFPFPQIAITGDSVWVFWTGQGTEVYGVNSSRMFYNRISSLTGNFVPGARTALAPADDCAPMRFSVAVDADHNIRIVYPFGTAVNREGLRCKTWTCATNRWTPDVTAPGRSIYNEGAAVTTFAYEPRLICPQIMGQTMPMLSCAKAYTTLGGGSPRILFKILDGIITVTDRSTLSEINRCRVWTGGTADTGVIPGLSLAVRNSSDEVSNTDDVNSAEFNVGDYFDLTGTVPQRHDLLFLTDADSNRVKILRANDNLDHCFGGDLRWDVPGKSDGTPSQSYRIATMGGEGTYRVWAGPDTSAWTIVNDLLTTGPDDRVCEVNRYTREVRFGDNSHGAIPPAGSFIRVRYAESVDEAEFGGAGSGNNQMVSPHGVAARYNAGLGHFDVYVCDSGNSRVDKWSYNPNPAVDPASWSSPVVSWGTASGETDLLSAPEDISVVTLHNQIYLVVSDNANQRLVVYRDDAASGSGGTAAPVYVTTIGGAGTSLNGFMDPRGLACMAEDSGLVIYAADAQRNEVAKIVQRDWLSTGAPDTSGGTQSSVLNLSLRDVVDGDSYLLLQPGAVRTIELRVARCDSLTGLHIYGMLPDTALHLIGIGEGNLWSGERYTNRIFLYSSNDTTGTFEINAAMVGDNDGLSTSASRVVATLIVRADSALSVPYSGAITVSDSSDLRRAGNRRITAYTRTDLNVVAGYLADIASDDGDCGMPPRMIPQPDGRIDFADINAFTQGWNGDGRVSDPLADIGPFLGDTPPNLVANPDGRMDAYDLLALSTMYNYDHSISPFILPPHTNARALDETQAVTLTARQESGRCIVDACAHDLPAFTTAHIRIEGEDDITTVRCGDLFTGQSTLFLHKQNGRAADICLGRLDKANPCVNGSGVLAVVELSVPQGVAPKVRVLYELRDNHNTIVASGESALENAPLPLSFGLDAPYPNPFNATTTFTLSLNAAGHSTLKVYNMLGQEAATILNADLPAGLHRITWDARNQHGVPLSSGLYLVRLESPGHSAVRKIVLLK